MITNEELEAMPDGSPDESFIYIADKMRARLRELYREDNGNWDNEREYVNVLRAFIMEYHLPVGEIIHNEPPVPTNDFGAFYHEFNVKIDQYIAFARIRESARRKIDNITLSQVTRSRIHHHISKIRDILHRLEIETSKKEQIFARLNHFAEAVDMDRTDIRRLLDLILEIAGAGSEISKQLEPVRKQIDAISSLFAEARALITASLPPWRAPKQIEAPKRRLPSPKSDTAKDIATSSELDDDIPF